jgi:hypothetical protein
MDSITAPDICRRALTHNSFTGAQLSANMESPAKAWQPDRAEKNQD